MPPALLSAPAYYSQRLEELQQQRLRLKRKDRLLMAGKLIVGLIVIAAGIWLAKYHPPHLAYLLLPLFALALLFVVHERTLKALRQNDSLRQMYEQGVGRLEDRWQGSGESGERYLEQAVGPDPQTHPYARDLDIFGPGSLYQLLCTARTRIGQDTLAAWLLAPTGVVEILDRQQALRELAPLYDFRERLALAAANLHTRAQRSKHAPVDSFANPLVGWSEMPNQLNRKLLAPAIVLALLWVGSIVAWQVYGFIVAAIAMSLINIAFGSGSRSKIAELMVAVEAAAVDIELLAALFNVIEQQSFTSVKMQTLKARLLASRIAPSQALKSLNRRTEWLFSADNWFVKILGPFLFFKLQCALSLEAWRSQHGASVGVWLAAIGEMEALTALSLYTCENPEAVFPVFDAGIGPLFQAEDFAHPLLPRARAVPNTLRLDRELQMIVISGPNMAGKSTFIRSIGVNAVLAQAGAPVRARSMRLSPLTIAASICILDSLQGGLSRFYAEIMRLKRIDELSRQPTPVLFLLDELLSGTNSHDRRAGTESMVRNLVACGAIGLVTTHDLALAEIATGMGARAANYHFEDRYENGGLHFAYKLEPGVVQTSNALQLMRSIGLDV